MTANDTATRNADIERHGLNEVMQFGHVIQVHPDGTVTDAPTDTYPSWAPSLTGDSGTGKTSLTSHPMDPDGWGFFSYGYSGQQGGAGSPDMHDSESIGGRLERDILANPGFYVAVYCTWDATEDDDTDDGEQVIEGWAVAYRGSL